MKLNLNLSIFLLLMMLAAVPAEAENNPLSLYLKTGLQYDDNIQLEPLEQNLFEDEDDWGTEVFFSGRYNMVDNESFQLGTRISFYQIWHNELSQYDMTGVVGNLYALYRFSKFSAGLAYIPSFYWVDSEKYLGRQQFRPEISWHTDNFMTNLSYSFYENSEYVVENYEQDERDDITHEYTYFFLYRFEENAGSISGSLEYENNKALVPESIYNKVTGRLRISISLPWSFIIGMSGKYSLKSYDQKHSIYGITREDNIFSGGVSLSRSIFWDWLSFEAEIQYTENQSNIDKYEYDRTVSTLSMILEY